MSEVSSLRSAALSKIVEFFPDCTDVEQATPEALHIDSFMLIQIILTMETTFDIEFEDAMLELGAFKTLGQLANYVEQRASNGSRTAPSA